MNKIYTAQVTSRGGREGFVKSSDGKLNLKLSQPSASADSATNPEQLFAAGYAACFHSALKMIAKNKGIETEGSEVAAEVSLFKGDAADFRLSVTLNVSVPGLDAGQTQQLAEEAHQVCPYSRATRGDIDVEVKTAAPQR
ncbi:organic hydroperoxide resistance protein [Cohnella ginsengisoli]|uniref:Organic hydroperoxide resistance protein n=1 Tax=Cohnella ginsengisoli TaxID=425004 RepID=A0A9X4KKD0_9BACL|nr:MULTISPECIES: organic hydroperoxide resistance protein [Cohnella]MDG0791897.1 organic hydroperoxide resistance protein [Cohnella ginsengisoli]SFA70337.1 peroxiredoxin, Ohr subfamily [Cohnella sp. OV330]